MGTTCTDCGRALVSYRTWRAQTPAKRDELREKGVRAHMGHGLCAPCYTRARYEAKGPVEQRVAACRDCARMMATRQKRRKAPAGQRPLRHGGRGLCSTCYKHRVKAGTLEDVPMLVTPRADLLEDWQTLRQPGLPWIEQVRQAAPRLGKSPRALEQALRRAGIREAAA